MARRAPAMISASTGSSAVRTSSAPISTIFAMPLDKSLPTTSMRSPFALSLVRNVPNCCFTCSAVRSPSCIS